MSLFLLLPSNITFVKYTPHPLTYSDTMFNEMTSDWKKKRPVWILMLISSLTEENIKNRNIPLLDLFMDNVAENLGKKVQAMESPRDQCRPLNKISNEKVRVGYYVASTTY